MRLLAGLTGIHACDGTIRVDDSAVASEIWMKLKTFGSDDRGVKDCEAVCAPKK